MLAPARGRFPVPKVVDLTSEGVLYDSRHATARLDLPRLAAEAPDGGQLRIKRFDPEADRRPHCVRYTVEAEPTDRVLDALHHIKWTIDGTLSFRRSCGHGVCGSDAMMINGRNALACQLLLRDEGTEICVEPLRVFPVIKDLVVDMEPFWAKYRILPWLVTTDDPGLPEAIAGALARAGALCRASRRASPRLALPSTRS